MADLSYDVQVNTSQAERNLANLQKSVGGLNDAFVRFKSTLATISLGAVIGQAVKFADAIMDISDATDIGIANIIGFGKAVEQFGGSTDGAQKGLLKLVNGIGEAADGSASMQNAFSAVGVTLDDLARLSNQDILKKTIDGLDKITDSAKRSTLITQLLGKEFRGVATGQLGAAYAAATAESARYADAIKKAADAQGNIDKTLGEFKIALLDAIKPFTELVSKINIGVDAFQKFVQAIIAVGAAFLAWTAVAKAYSILKLLVVGIYEIGAGFVAVLPQIINFFRNFGMIIENVKAGSGIFSGLMTVVRAVGSVFAETLGPAFTALKTIAMPVLAGIAGYWGWIQDSTSAAIDKLREYASALTFGLISPPDTVGGGRGNGQAELDQRKKDAEALEKEKNVLREVTDALAKRRAEIQKASQAFKDQNNQIFDNLNLEKSLIGKSEDFIEVERAREEVLKRAADESAKLQEAKKALTKDEQSLSAVYDQQIAKIHAVAQVDADRIAKNIEGLQGLRMVEKARLQDIENTTKALEDQFARQQQLNDILSGVGQQQLDVRGQRTVGETAGLSTIQKQLLEIQDRAKSAAQEAGRAFAANFESEDGLTPERAEELARGLDQISGAFAKLTLDQEEFAQRNYESSRTFQAGWDEAFTRFAESTTNTAEQTAQYFDKLTNGMADAFGKMAESGKWSFSDLKNSFKDLANSMIADFIRIMAKRAILGLMGGGGGFLSSLFGRANGGDVSGETPYIVGERGPELFIPKSAGTVISNSQLNSTGSGNREPVSVTYNISAVDASSFRSLVARDPSFIYAITEKGRQSQPRARMA
jgi:lambda family phage tail tape measure protein